MMHMEIKFRLQKKTENIQYVVSKYQINGTTDDAVYDMTRAAVSSLIAIAALRAFDDQRAHSVGRFCCRALGCTVGSYCRKTAKNEIQKIR